MASFLSISTLDDLANYFGYASYEKFKGLIYPAPLYWGFFVSKKSGGTRFIETPGAKLKQLQRKLATELRDCFGKRSPSAHSFRSGKSVVTNALPHVRQRSVVRVDLSDFFHQVHFGRVKGVFLSPPFSFPADVAAVLAHLCCVNKRLPQGAPTSPILTNYVCQSMDRQLRSLAARYKARYTRYADDLTFSFTSTPLQKIPRELFITVVRENGAIEIEAGPLLVEAIRKQGFIINLEKTYGANSDKRQIVTGIVVNNGLSVPSRYISELRRALFLWRKGGLAEVEAKAMPVLHRKRYASGVQPSAPKVIRGKLAWLANVVGRSGRQYQRLATEFNALASRDGLPDLTVKIDPRVQSYEDADRATWYLLAEGSLSNGYDAVNGTAFRFENNVWITCAHCVGSLLLKEVLPQIRLSRREPGVPTIFVRVVDVDWHRDIAVLRPLPMEPVPKSLAYFCRARQLPEREDQVGLMGFPSSIEHHPPGFMRARVVSRLLNFHR